MYKCRYLPMFSSGIKGTIVAAEMKYVYKMT